MKKIIISILVLFTLTACTKEVDLSVSRKERTEEETVEEIKIFEGKESSLNNLLTIEDIALVSKYNTISKDFQEVDLQLLEIFRNYSLEDEEYERKNNHELIRLEYEVNLLNFKTESFGTDSLLQVEVLAINGEPLIYDGVKQTIDIEVIEKDEQVLKNEKGRTKILFEVPQGTEKFLIIFGETGKTRAYFEVL